MGTTMAGHNYSRVQGLGDCIRLIRSVVKEGERKVPNPENLWALCLLAKIATSATSVDVLIREGCIVDTKLLLRSMLDATIDLLFVMHGPLTTRQLAKLYHAELIEDQYHRFKFESDRRGVSLDDFIKANPRSKAIIEAYNKQKQSRRKPPAGVELDKFGMPWESRWRFLSAQMKLKYLPGFDKMMELAKYGLRNLGDAHAHARPVALQLFATMRKTNDFRGEELHYVVNPKPREYIHSKEYIAFEACLLILISCDKVIDHYCLDQRLSKRLQLIYDRIRDLIKAKRKSTKVRKR